MSEKKMPVSKVGFQAVNLTKHFAGVPALAGISFDLKPGEIVGLVGHNGAGKSTLLKVLAGAHKHDGGELYLDGKSVVFSSPAEAISHGVSTVYQELSLIPNLTVQENIWLGRELSGIAGLRKAEMRKFAQQMLNEFHLEMDVDRSLGSYPVAARQMLEIAIAATKNTKYLLLDEPTTSLEGEQISRLLDYVKDIAKRKNVGVLLVDHKLDELYEVAHRIVALVDGKVILDADAGLISHEEVVRAIVGDDIADAQEKGMDTTRIGKTSGEVILSISDVHGPHLQGVSFDAREGQIIGLYGLVGAGRTELLRSLIGVEPIYSGEVELFRERYIPKNPADAMKCGFAYLTEERKIDGIVPGMSSPQNIALPVVTQFSTGGWINNARLSKMTSEFLNRLHVRGNTQGPIVALSGGNQQKVLIARTLAQQPKILLLDEPTKGVDIGVKSEIHSLLKSMVVDEGMTLIVSSSEEEEILELADVVTVFAHGKTVASAIPVENLTVAKLRELAWITTAESIS
ncbi:sugar ABC transporter ATP-binding protein [Arcanobacterium phocae]|nr:sugar ABC transporter ATP-binding protein [Arcanobacterium phocae]